MARFVLDIANLSREQIEEIQTQICETFPDKIITIECIDESNDNQFHEDQTNELTEEQINYFATV